MSEFFYRTEDLKPDEVLTYYAETKNDRNIVSALKGRNPVILIGSRGVGKSFLLRVAEAELAAEFEQSRVLPVYVSLMKSSLIQTNDPQQFQHWILAKISSAIVRALLKRGLIISGLPSIPILVGDSVDPARSSQTKMERLVSYFEESWKTPGQAIDLGGLPTIERFHEAVEDACASLNIERAIIMFDEAAHILLPEQQRQFFTLFRDLRSSYLTCNAAVYPGVTSYGETFQAAHDAIMLPLHRDVLAADYIDNMREIVQKQADSTTSSNIARNGENFAILAYAASGNPRILLKTLARAPNVNSSQVNEVIREYYRNEIWSEHSGLAERYVGHKTIIDWGRRFIETDVLPNIKRRNDQITDSDKQTTCFFWVHRDSPAPIKEALRLLAYTGIVMEHSTGIRATRSEVGSRYIVNLGSLFALESQPAQTAFQVAKNLDVRRMVEYGRGHPAYKDLTSIADAVEQENMSEVLRRLLERPLDALDLPGWQRDGLKSIGLRSIGDVFRAPKSKLQEIKYIGEIRSGRIQNATTAAVLEYLSG